MSDKGIYQKFIVLRVDRRDEPGEKHEGCQYFVLDINHDPHAMPAIKKYAQACKKTHPKLSNDLMLLFETGGIGLDCIPKAKLKLPADCRCCTTAVNDFADKVKAEMGKLALASDHPDRYHVGRSSMYQDVNQIIDQLRSSDEG